MVRGIRSPSLRRGLGRPDVIPSTLVIPSEARNLPLRLFSVGAGFKPAPTISLILPVLPIRVQTTHPLSAVTSSWRGLNAAYQRVQHEFEVVVRVGARYG